MRCGLAVLVALLSALGNILPAQLRVDAEVFAPLRHHWSRSYNRLVKGGDGRHYLFQTRSGNFWGFGQTGEAHARLMVFDAEYRYLGMAPIRMQAGEGSIRTYEAIPSRDGIVLLAALQSKRVEGAYLSLCKPIFEAGELNFRCDTLLFMPQFVPMLQVPRFRLAWSPDSSYLAIAWRNTQLEEDPDNSLSCLFLDRDLKPVGSTVSPLSRIVSDVSVMGMAVVDAEQLLFYLRMYDGRGLFNSPQPVGQVLAHYDRQENRLRPIVLGKGCAPIDLKLRQDTLGRWWAMGVYVGPPAEKRELGLFAGLVAGSDSLANLQLYPLHDTIRSEILLEQNRAGDQVTLRMSFYNVLMDVKGGFVYVLNLRGSSVGIRPRMVGQQHNNVLLSWRFDTGFRPREMRTWSYYSSARTDYFETFSWQPIRYQGKGYALCNDFSTVSRIRKPVEAGAWLLPLSGDGPALRAFDPEADAPFSVLAPRQGLPLGDGEMLFIARSDRYLRLVKLGLDE